MKIQFIKKIQPVQKCLRAKFSAVAKVSSRNFIFLQFNPLVKKCLCAKVSSCSLYPRAIFYARANLTATPYYDMIFK